MPLHFQSNRPSNQWPLAIRRRAVAGRCISSPRLFCIQARRAFYLRTIPTTTAVTYSKSRAIERFHRLIHLAACSLIYNTDTINIPQPPNSQPASVSFHRSSHETFLPRQPCIGICLIALSTVGVLVATSPNVFGMSSMHARVVLCIPARLYSLTPCRLVVLSVSSVPPPSVTIVANRIGLTLSTKFCHCGCYLVANSPTI
jgi:hypothetical protein